MSQFDYIGSPKAIEYGIYGSTRLFIEDVEIFDDKKAIVNGNVEINAGILSFKDKDIEWFRRALMIFEDGVMAGVHISSILSVGGAIRDHFENEYVYKIQLNTVTANTSEPSLKRLKELERDKDNLVSLLKGLDIGTGFFELFSSWADEEREPRVIDKDMTFTIEEVANLDYIILEDRQYIRITI